jgi:hypothetical protein
MARVQFAGGGSTIEFGQIRDLSLTTRAGQRTTLHHDLVIIQPPIDGRTSSNHLRAAARTNPMKQYKPLLSSAPANSILNAQQFHYTNSASTDIRKTFANFRRNASRQHQPSFAANVRTLKKNPIGAALAPSSPEPLRRSSG